MATFWGTRQDQREEQGQTNLARRSSDARDPTYAPVHIRIATSR
jgi:hypothetical protein